MGFKKGLNIAKEILLAALAMAVFFAAGIESASAQNMMGRAWGMLSGNGIEVSKAWSVTKNATTGNCSNSKVVVAIIDTGIDISHPALKNSLWTNEKEAKGKPGKDDDVRGKDDTIKDDLHGYDFARNTGDLVDSHGHGTHIAGIITGNTLVNDPFRGVCPGVKIMGLRYYNEKASGDENLRNTIKAINYAIDHGANIINYSGGGAMYSSAEFQALKRAEDKGILVVAAAGNEMADADKNFFFPAAYDLKNIISVTAIDSRGKILPSSNWGVSKVHVAAPGNSILSTLPNNSYGFMTGTSQATAFVTGVAALMLTENAKLSVARIKSIIEESSYPSKDLVGKAKTSARLNAWSAVMLTQGKRTLSSTQKITEAEIRHAEALNRAEEKRRANQQRFHSR